MQRLPALLLSIALLAACSDDGATAGGGAGAPTGAGGALEGGGNAQGGEGGAGAQSGTVTGVRTPLYLGVHANALTPGGATATPASVIEADLTAYASGARVMGVDVAWDALDQPLALEIAARIAAHRDQQMRIVVSFLVVDGGRGHRPAAIPSWSDAGAAPALFASLDLLLAEIDEPDAMIVGRRSDVYLEKNPGDASSVSALLASAISHLGSRGVDAGVGTSYAADPNAEHAGLTALGALAAFSYLPGLGEQAFPANASPAMDLDAMVARAAGRPIVLSQIGYPSSADLGSSVEMQMAQLDGFFAALEPRAESVPYALVHQLHDLDAPSCDAWLASQGLSVQDPAGDHWCSTGLRGVDAVPKAAWARFLVATAHYAQP